MYPVTARITQGYGVKSKKYEAGFHDGVDFGCAVGTKVYSARKGIVVANQWGKDYGIHVVCKRTYPWGTKNHLVYAHLSKVIVKPGQKIKKGQLLGLSGSTGKSTGPHLHFGERNGATFRGTNPVNPQKTLEA